MSTDNPQEVPATLETVAKWAHSNREWDRVYRYLFLHPNDFFVIPPTRRWPISHQVVYHGDVDLLKRILVLFSNDDINIRTKSLDEKTLLDVATQRREKKPDMFNYVDRLFTQDELIVQAKNSNWAEVKKILEKNNNLANEKPPYSPYFLLHYIVQNGNARILQDFLSSFQFLTNLLNNRNETPLNMAKRLLKQDICRILEPRTLERSPFINNQPETPPPPSEHLYRSDERVTFHAATSLSNESIPYDTLSSMPPLPTQTIDTKPKLPPIGFSGIVVDITENGDFTFGPSTLVNSGVHPQMPPLPQPQQQAPPKQPPQPTTSTLTRRVNRSIIQEVPLTNMESPPPPSPPPPPRPSPLTAAASSATNEQLKKNLTCPLSQEIFKDPVIASDGQTYERAAILDWVNYCHHSPTTGAPMDATFRDNIEIRNMIQSLQRQS